MGKSCIGEWLAKRLCLPFVDADEEIEKAAGCSIAEIFDTYGEKGNKTPPNATGSNYAAGGGAFMDNQTRKAIKQLAISIWLKVDLRCSFHELCAAITGH